MSENGHACEIRQPNETPAGAAPVQLLLPAVKPPDRIVKRAGFAGARSQHLLFTTRRRSDPLLSAFRVADVLL
jgi:hypothetical protein